MKKLIGRILLAGSMTFASSFAGANEHHDGGALFVMTNDAEANEVIAYDRYADGSLHQPHGFKTDGRGSGGKVDPLASQGALTLSQDREWLFAVNAGSGTLSVFRVEGAYLDLTDRIRTEGSEPNSVTQHGNLVYVLNTAGSSSVVGFYFYHGHLERIPDSIRFLSANAVASGSVSFSPDGRFLLVTEKATNKIDTFRVRNDGTLAPIVENSDVGPGTFSATFTPAGVAIVAETGPAGPNGGAIANASAISSYRIQADGTLKAVTASLATLGTANCWSVVTAKGRFVYTSNSASSSISGYEISANGALTPIGSTVVANLPAGSINIDTTSSADGKYLYTLNGGNGTIGAWAIEPTYGSLTSLGSTGHFAPASGFNGIAAY
jgi:6-phosphogluconolactonase